MSSPRFPLSKTPKHVIFFTLSTFCHFYHSITLFSNSTFFHLTSNFLIYNSGTLTTLESLSELNVLQTKFTGSPVVIGCFSDQDVAAAAMLPSKKERLAQAEAKEEEEEEKEWSGMAGSVQEDKKNQENKKNEENDSGTASSTSLTTKDTKDNQDNVKDSAVPTYNITHDYQSFIELAQVSGGDYVFARIKSKNCPSILGSTSLLGTATILMDEMHSVFTFPNVSSVPIESRTALLSNFLETRLKSMVVGELTPDNSHTYLDQAEPVLLVLCHPEEPKQNTKAKKIALKLSQSFGAGNLLLSWADGPEFATQFMIENSKKRFPAFLLLSKMKSDKRSNLKTKILIEDFDKTTGRLPDAMIDFPTYVYHR